MGNESIDEDVSEQTLHSKFTACELVIEDSLKGELEVNKNDKLTECIKTLQTLEKFVKMLNLFSTNDQLEELPTSSVRYLLIPAFLAYALQEIHPEMDKRAIYVDAAKAHYREYLESLFIFGVISFKLPWLEVESIEDEEEASTARLHQNSFDESVAKRQQKIIRSKQLEQLNRTLEQLRLEYTRSDDEFTQREINLILLRLWSIRAINELDMLEEELKILKYFEENKNTLKNEQKTKPTTAEGGFKPLIIARTEEQKKVFGLGYPSIPTVTVDEWYDQMSKSGGFGKTNGRKQPSNFSIGNDDVSSQTSSDEDEKNDEKRRKMMMLDEYKDMHRRGWGNTHNKG